jgi:hypothetical protein
MDDSEDDDSQAPDVAPEAVGANSLPQVAGNGTGGGAGTGPPPAANHAQHPVWAAAAGRGRGTNKSKPESMFGPISMLELEIRGRNDLDGASSTASDRGGGRRDKDVGKRSGKKKKKRPREYDDDGEDSEEEAGDEDGAESSASVDMAGAAFGGGAGGKRACRPCASEASDDGVSVTSSVVRRRHERAFPVTGVTCVGCALPAKITPVVDFIAKNMSSMAELALYKMAALVYKTKVAEPAEEEGVDVPSWGARAHAHARAKQALTPHLRAAHAQTGRRSARTSSCTRSTRACSATRTSARSRRCARPSRCSCCAATRRRASSRSTRTTPRPS